MKDYTDKELDADYMRLTCLQRYVLDGCCRLRGRSGKNLPNDATTLARLLHVARTDAPHIPHAVSTLLTRGFLVLSNQQLDFTDKDKEEEKEIDKSKKKPSAKPVRGTSSPGQVLPKDLRHARVRSLVMNAYHEQTGADCPWDGGEGSQLKALLAATPGWHDTQLAQCLVNMYASGGFAKGTRPREFLPRLPKYLHGPLNEFNREQVNGNKGVSASKAEERDRRIEENTKRVAAEFERLHRGDPAALSD